MSFITLTIGRPQVKTCPATYPATDSSHQILPQSNIVLHIQVASNVDKEEVEEDAEVVDMAEQGEEDVHSMEKVLPHLHLVNMHNMPTGYKCSQ